MKKWLMIPGLLLFALNVLAGQIIEVEIHGMTCAFCVDAVQRNLTGLPDVRQAEVSLELKKVRIYPVEQSVDLARIRETIVDSGFTPVNVWMLDVE